MGKYIITFDDNSEVEEDGVKYFRCTEVPWSYTSEIIISKLTPYTEPDTEQVREDAFKNGYDAACKDIDVKSKTNAAYRKGLDDAWEAVKKLERMDTDTSESITGQVGLHNIMHNLTASEAIEKIRQYEQEQTKEAIPHRNYQYLSDYWCECGWHLGKKGAVKFCADCGRRIKWD